MHHHQVLCGKLWSETVLLIEYFSKTNKNCGPDAICPDEQCQIHCRNGNAKRQR